MMELLKKAVALTLLFCLAIPAVRIGALAAETVSEVKIECESSDYTASKSDGSVWTPKNTSASLKTVDGNAKQGVIFTDGDVGSTIRYTVNAEGASQVDLPVGRER